MKNFFKKFIGILISLLFVYMIFNKLDLQQTVESFRLFNPIYLLWVIPIFYFSYWVRVYRWKVLLPETKACEFVPMLSIMFIGQVCNCLLPARAGDFYRSHLIGKECNLKSVKAFASIFVERIFDGSVVLFILIYSIMSFFKEPWIYQLLIFVGIFFWGGFVSLFLLAKFGRPNIFVKNSIKLTQKLPEKIKTPITSILEQIDKHLNSFVEGLSVFNSLFDILKVTLYTVILWTLEGLIIFLIAKGFGIKAGLIASLFTMVIAVFGSMIPAASAMIGPYQYAFIVGFGVFGIEKETALAISITCQTILLVMIGIGGFLSMLYKNVSLEELKEGFSPSEK